MLAWHRLSESRVGCPSVHPQLATLDDVAHMLGLHPKTVAQRLSETDELPGVRVGHSYRFWRPAVQAFARGEQYSDPAMDDTELASVELMSVAQAAAQLGLAENTVRALAKKGQLPAMQIVGVWRIRWPALRDQIAGINT